MRISISTDYEVKVYAEGELIENLTVQLWDKISKNVRAALETSTPQNTPQSQSAFNLPPFVESASIRSAVGLNQGADDRGDYISEHEKAWLRIGRPATATEIYEEMKNSGYISKAQKPVRSVKEAIRNNNRFFKFAEGGPTTETLWAIKDSGYKAEDYSLKTHLPPNSLRYYAEKCLEDTGKPVNTETLIALMMGMGWSTNSQSPKHTINTTMSRYPDVFAYENGMWFLKKWDGFKDGTLDLDAAAEQAFLNSHQ